MLFNCRGKALSLYRLTADSKLCNYFSCSNFISHIDLRVCCSMVGMVITVWVFMYCKQISLFWQNVTFHAHNCRYTFALGAWQ